MSSIFAGRTRGRAQAIQLLFQAQVQEVEVGALVDGGEYALDEGPLEAFGERLARGVAARRPAIDCLLSAVSHNWNLSRMPLVDRTIMAVAIYELLDVDGDDPVPPSVAIAEAVEIAKVYGTDDSSSFVNGVLGRVARLASEHPGAGAAELASLVDPSSDAGVDEGADGQVGDAPAAESAPGPRESPAPLEVPAPLAAAIASDGTPEPAGIEGTVA